METVGKGSGGPKCAPGNVASGNGLMAGDGRGDKGKEIKKVAELCQQKFFT